MLLESPAQHRAQGPRWAAWAAGTGKEQDGEGPNQTGNSEAPQSPPRPPRHTEDGAAPSTPPKARRSLGMHPGAGGTTLSTSWERQLPAREQTQHPGALLQHLPAPSGAVLHRATRWEEGAERRPSAPRARAQVTPAPPGHSRAPQALPRRPQAPCPSGHPKPVPSSPEDAPGLPHNPEFGGVPEHPRTNLAKVPPARGSRQPPHRDTWAGQRPRRGKSGLSAWKEIFIKN